MSRVQGSLTSGLTPNHARKPTDVFGGGIGRGGGEASLAKHVGQSLTNMAEHRADLVQKPAGIDLGSLREGDPTGLRGLFAKE